MHVLVLGKIVLFCPKGSVAVAPGRSRTRGLLALLALNAGRALTHEAITRALWRPAPPNGCRSQIYAAICDIRKRFRDIGYPNAIGSGAFGYRLDLPAECIDVNEFNRQLKQARHLAGQGNHAAAAERLREALELHQGEPLADASGAFVDAARACLTEQRLVALEELAAAQLALGQHRELISELIRLVSEYPARESLRGHLMLAMHRSGRQAEALQLFQDYRRLRAEQDGLDPGGALATLANAILLDELSRPPAAAQSRRTNQVPDHRWTRTRG